MNYYNEFDPRAAEWLRELIKHGHIPPGEVDERSIKDVTANDLSGFIQCHFFAGIGGWSYDLRLADWRRVAKAALADGRVRRTEVIWISPNTPAREATLAL